MIDEIISTLCSIGLQDWALAVIGGMIFAGVFNIPARKRFLSRESDSRHKAVIYDALNFLVFYITFIFAQGMETYVSEGSIARLTSVTALFLVYTLSFWIVLKSYMRYKDNLWKS